MPYLASFACLWCGAAHVVPDPGRPRGLGAALPRLPRQGRRQRVPALPAAPGDHGAWPGERVGRRWPNAAEPEVGSADAAGDAEAALVPYYEARAGEYDDWYLRRGRYARGADPRRRPGTPSSTWPGGGWTRLPIARRDRRAGRRDRLVVAAARAQGRAVALRRERRAARAGARPPGRARVACAPPRPRRLGRAGPPGGRRVRRLLAEPHPARPARRRSSRSSGAGSSRAAGFAFIDSLPDPQSSRGRPPDPRRRRLASGASTTAASSRSSRSTTRRDELEAALLEAGFAAAEVTTTGRFFVLGKRHGLSARSRRHLTGCSSGPRSRPPALYSGRCPPSRRPRSRRSAPASWPRR